MSRKDYQAMAETLGRRKAGYDRGGELWSIVDDIQQDIADEYERQNDRFDRDRFNTETDVVEIAWRLVLGGDR
jgi:hypothetical protein